MYEFVEKRVIFDNFVAKMAKYAYKLENRQIMHFMEIKAVYAQKSLFTKTAIFTHKS